MTTERFDDNDDNDVNDVNVDNGEDIIKSDKLNQCIAMAC